MHWDVNEVVLEPVQPDPSCGIDVADLVQALSSEASVWNDALVGCVAPHLRISAPRAGDTPRLDGHNLVVVLCHRWCPADGASAPCYDPTAQAITHLRPYEEGRGPRAAEIREADVEINGVSFRWSPSGDRDGTRSLRAALAHEIGHVLGLDDVCARTAGEHRAACSARMKTSIMYPDPTEEGRDLVVVPSADAVRGLCTPARSASPPP
jgi:hypothetical protein